MGSYCQLFAGKPGAMLPCGEEPKNEDLVSIYTCSYNTVEKEYVEGLALPTLS